MAAPGKTKRLVHSFELGLLEGFMNMKVLVDTPVGVYSGVLRRIETGRRHGIGCLLLETRGGWLLVKFWTAVKRRE